MSERPKECKARQYADQMRCLKCGMVWDTNDPEPPECKPEQRKAAPPGPQEPPRPVGYNPVA